MSSIRGWPSSKKKGDTQGQHVTIEPMGPEQYGMTVAAKIFAYVLGTDAVEAGSTTTVIVATAHVAKAGDVIRFTSGALDDIETKVIETATNSITVADTLSVAPSAADTFQILRPRWPVVNDAGQLTVSSTPGPTQFVLDGVDTEVEESTGTPANSRPLPVKILLGTGAEADLATETTQAAGNVLTGAVTETAPATDTASSGLNGRLQRIAQRLTSLIALLPSSIGQKTGAGSLSVILASDQALPLPTGAATEATLAGIGVDTAALAAVNFATEATLTQVSIDLANLAAEDFATETTQAAGNVLLGAVTETAPATDTASSGLNGRLQRIAQRLTSLIALLPASLGQLASAASLSVVVANDQSAIATKAPVNTAGSAANTSLTGTTASTATAPANAVGFILYADTDNAHTIRFAIGATASTSVGGRLEPGRDTGYLPCAANVSVCATASGTNAFFIQWILSA